MSNLELGDLINTNLETYDYLEYGNMLMWDEVENAWVNSSLRGDVVTSYRYPMGNRLTTGETLIRKINGHPVRVMGEIDINAKEGLKTGGQFLTFGDIAMMVEGEDEESTNEFKSFIILPRTENDYGSDDFGFGKRLSWSYSDVQFIIEGEDNYFHNGSYRSAVKLPRTAVSLEYPGEKYGEFWEYGEPVTLATTDNITDAIDAAELNKLADTDINNTIALEEGDILVWDDTNRQWFNREVSGDIDLDASGGVTVNKIGGESVALGGELITSGEFSTSGGDILLSVLDGKSSDLILPANGTLATREYLLGFMPDMIMENLTDVIYYSREDGSMLLWRPDNLEGTKGEWVTRTLMGDGFIDSTGNLSITHIGGQPINLGGELSTSGKFITTGGDITLRVTGGSADLILPSSGTLATLDNITDMIKASNLTDLNDVDINADTLDGGQILVWDDTSDKWTNRDLTGDIDLNASGNTTVKSIGGYPVALGGDFTTYGKVTFNLSEAEANLTLPAEGVLATLEGNEIFLNKIIKDSNGSFDKLSLDFESNKYGDKTFDEHETVRWVMTSKDENGTAEWRKATDIGGVWAVGTDERHSELSYYDDNEAGNKSVGIGFSFNLINEDETPYPVRDNQGFNISEENNIDTTLDYQLYVGRKNPFGGSIYAYGHIMAQDYYEFSDKRLKENIASISSYAPVMDKIRNIEGIYYDWNSLYYDKNKISKKQKRQIGFIAQKLEKEFPELVQTETDGFKSVTYSKFVPVLLEGIKELDTQLNRRENSIFIDPDGNINLKGIVKIDDATLIDKEGNIAVNNLKVKGSIQTSDTFSILRSDTLASLITISTEKRADKKAEGYISARDIYIADKGRWASEFDSRIKIVSETPDDSSCSTENAGEMRFVSKDSTLCICGEKGVWLKFNTSEKEKKLASYEKNSNNKRTKP